MTADQMRLAIRGADVDTDATLTRVSEDIIEMRLLQTWNLWQWYWIEQDGEGQKQKIIVKLRD